MSPIKSNQTNTIDPIIGTWNLNFTATPLQRSTAQDLKADKNEQAVVFEGGFTFHTNGTILVTCVPQANDSIDAILPPQSYGNWKNLGDNHYEVVISSTPSDKTIKGEAIAYFELSKDCKALQFAGVSGVSAR
jgi:hypothetical protein